MSWWTLQTIITRMISILTGYFRLWPWTILISTYSNNSVLSIRYSNEIRIKIIMLDIVTCSCESLTNKMSGFETMQNLKLLRLTKGASLIDFTFGRDPFRCRMKESDCLVRKSETVKIPETLIKLLNNFRQTRDFSWCKVLDPNRRNDIKSKLQELVMTGSDGEQQKNKNKR